MKMKYVNRIVYFLILISLITFQPDVQAKGEISGKGKTQVNKVLGTPQATWFTINNVTTILRNDGMSDLNGQDSGFEYPKGANKTVFYESGFVYGGNFNGEFRIGGSTYNHSQVPGRILDDGTAESADLDHVRIYRVRRDYKSADADFTAEINKSGGTAASVYAQYDADWTNWPAQYGAPYEDVDGNGSYNPSVDIPGVPGADQTIWFVANDLDPTAQQQFYGTLGLGCEMQATFWGYNTTGALGNAMFRKYTLINKSGVDITDMYVCMWSDPDLGDAGDDYTGCDIDLSLGYIYNGDDNDAQYGVNVPAGGFDFFQGPIVPQEGSQAIFGGEVIDGYANLGMSAYFFFINGDPVYQDPTLGDPTGAIEFRNLMEGKISTTGVPFVDPTTGEETKYTLSGDPLTGRGWVDGIIHRPGDRRLGMVAGTFTMAAGDVQEIVVGQFVAGGSLGISRLGAVGLLKFYDLELQLAYDNFFNVPPAVKPPIATAVALDQKVVVNWGDRWDIIAETESYDNLGYKFQGYCVYQLPSASATLEQALLVETFDIKDQVLSIESSVFDVTTNAITKRFTKFGRNTGIQRSILIDNDLVRGGVPIVNGTDYYFAVTAYAYNDDPEAVPNVLETPLTILTVTPQAPSPGYTLGEDASSSLDVDHSAGGSNASVVATVVDPSQLTGHDYEVYFTSAMYKFGASGVWEKVGNAGKRTPKAGDVSPSTIIATALYPEVGGGIDINFAIEVVSPTDAWVDGVRLTFPVGVTINSITHPHSTWADVDIDYTQPSPNEVFFGDNSLSEAGLFAGGETWTINISTTPLPFNVDYVIYDDGYDSGAPTDPINATGTITFTEVAEQSITQNQWNVKDLDTGEDVLTGQTIYSGVDIYAPNKYYAETGLYGPGGSTGSASSDVGANANVIFDGLRVEVNGNYDAPLVYQRMTLNGANLPKSTSRVPFALSDYTAFGFPSGRAIDAIGYGTNNIDKLQQDYELRWNGELETISVNGRNVTQAKEGTGQIATVFQVANSSTGWGFLNHPMNPDGSSNPFTVRIPFEVWNKDLNMQVNVLINDRRAGVGSTANEDPWIVWKTDSRRMYAFIVNTPYTTTAIDPAAVSDDITWGLVFFNSQWTVGDKIELFFANPLQVGVDEFSFATTATSYSAEKAKQDVNMINAFPNPYYGVNPREVNKYQKYITFSHLPQKATLRVFNLAGQLIRTIVKDDSSPFTTWSLSNEADLPVASGLYIVHIDMPELGTTKILKVAIVQEQQILDRF